MTSMSPALTAEHVLELVETDAKGRFDVAAEEGGGLVVRANQGAHGVDS